MSFAICKIPVDFLFYAAIEGVFQEKILRLDFFYVNKCSCLFDMKVFMNTFLNCQIISKR